MDFEREAVKKTLMAIPNVGPSVAEDLIMLGYRDVSQLKGVDPYDLYARSNALAGARQDPCLLDTFLAVVHFAETGERRKWWEFTPDRKKRVGSSK